MSKPIANLGLLYTVDYFRADHDKGLRYEEIGTTEKERERMYGISRSPRQKDCSEPEFRRYNHNHCILEQKAQRLFQASYIDEEWDDPEPFVSEGERFELRTLSPGLLLGAGTTHELNEENELKMGPRFDFATGLPIIPGSSLKGVLRSAFQHPAYIEDRWGESVDIAALEDEIFNEGDVFFDAEFLPSASKGKCLLGDGYFTPHNPDRGEMAQLLDPTPLRFAKVKPGAVFRFQFLLEGTPDHRAKKLRLFKHILLDIGIGGKTAYGYGQFDEH